MAKKFGKFLLFTAAVSGAAAAAYYYMRKKDTDGATLEDEDYDDFSEDLDEDAETVKNYVPLTPDTKASDTNASDEEKKEDTFVPLDQVAQSADTAEAGEDSKAASEVEEFFDEEDATDEEPPVNDN